MSKESIELKELTSGINITHILYLIPVLFIVLFILLDRLEPDHPSDALILISIISMFLIPISIVIVIAVRHSLWSRFGLKKAMKRNKYKHTSLYNYAPQGMFEGPNVISKKAIIPMLDEVSSELMKGGYDIVKKYNSHSGFYLVHDKYTSKIHILEIKEPSLVIMAKIFPINRVGGELRNDIRFYWGKITKDNRKFCNKTLLPLMKRKADKYNLVKIEKTLFCTKFTVDDNQRF